MPLVTQGKNQTSYFIYCWSYDNTVFRDMDFRGSSPVLNDYNNKIIIYNVYWVSTTYLAISHIPSSWLPRYVTLDKWLTLYKVSLCFLICKLGIIVVPFSQGYCEHHIWVNAGKAPSTVPGLCCSSNVFPCLLHPAQVSSTPQTIRSCPSTSSVPPHPQHFILACFSSPMNLHYIYLFT